MTSKEKAIKAFENVEKFISDLPMSVVGYNTPSTSEWVSDQLNIVEDHLNNPTLDDAIKVVEEMRNNAIRSSYYDKILITILTALKGLKGE